MNPTNAYLDRLKAAYSLPSDYALAKFLNVGRGRISHYRKSRHQMDESMCFRVAKLLDLHPAIVLADVKIFLAKSVETTEAWREIVETTKKAGAA